VFNREEVLQDRGPWAWYLTESWQQAASPKLYSGPTRQPDSSGDQKNPVLDPLYNRVAYWTPLLHLTSFGLGWTKPELGLWKWKQQGKPRTDPVLATVADRYGKDIDLMFAWLAVSGAEGLRQTLYADRSHSAVRMTNEMKIFIKQVRDSKEFAKRFGLAGDPLHLIPHLEFFSADSERPIASRVSTRVSGEQVDYVLIGDHYRSLFRSLHENVIPPMTGGRSTRVAVICPPIGWLGNYRRSRVTGLWFRGRHRWHELGN
jgi:hypothetical protein